MTENSMPQIQENVPLAQFTTIGIGGPARYYCRAETDAEIITSVEWASTNSHALFVLGGGSNLLISDAGFDGLVLHISTRGIEIDPHPSSATSVLLRAAAGEPWDPLVAFAVSRGLAGFECLSGIPGNAGATPIQNVGAYGQDVAETIESVEVYDRYEKRIGVITKLQCRFSYRASLFKNHEPDRYVVLRVHYRLSKGGPPAIRYPDLARYLEEAGVLEPSLQNVRDAILTIRRRKGMVVDPADPDSRSDGSFFMNPILTREEHRSFLTSAHVNGIPAETRIPAFPTDDDRVKLSAGWLIENAGFHRGYGSGAAGLSSKHSLAIINRGEASATDVRKLVEEIQNTVARKFGVRLHPEPNFIGFDDEGL